MSSKCHFLVKLWRATQVKLHGSYSANRVQDLAKYIRETSWFRAVLVSIGTPVPCLIVTLLIDVLPLSDPSKGVQANKLLFVREYYGFVVMTSIALHQFRKGVSLLPYSTGKLVRDTLIVSALTVFSLYGLALVIGFPLPFTNVVAVPTWVFSIVSAIAIQWTSKLQASPKAGKMLLGTIKLWLCEFLLVFIYPPYFHVFSTISTMKAKMAFALLLPVLKLLMRNLFSRSVGHLGDETPGLVVFHADVFGSLFVAYCMQSSPLLWMTLTIMAVDILVMGISLNDLKKIHKELEVLERRLDIWKSHHNALEYIVIKGRKPTALDRASVLLAHERVKNSNTRIQQERTGSTAPSSMREIGPVQSRLARVSLKRSYAAKVRRLLYMAEYVLLLNYVEVVIPLVFSIYLIATYHLPNRAYYPLYDGMDQHQLLHTLSSVLLYCFLQFLSLLILIGALKRMLGHSPIQHIAFVLEKQVDWVQMCLVFWLFYTVQGSLKHLGYDYSFRFSWL
eukprot:jgi/Phyca11/122125/e_gw1.47.87.1